MPQALLTAAVFAAQAIGSAASAAIVAAASAGTAGLAAAASLASIAYTSYATKKAEADARKNAAQAPRDITVRSATEPAKIIYGTARTSGPVVYTNTAPTPGTSDNNTLWTVISLCSHEVEDITDIWLDGDEITASQINWGGTGGVTSGKYGPIGSNEVTNFYKRLGTSTQSHVSELATAFTDWTSSYQGKNVAYIVSAFELGTATGEGVWAQGAPTNIRAVVKGKKVYDPRKDSTNGGSGVHRLADPTTWEWSDNPALCLADYLFDDRLGLGAEGVTYDDIDWALVIAAANICDATVSTPAGNEKRFTCNGALSTGNTYAENIKAILSSMNGQITWSGGKYRIRACAYEAPVYTFTGDDVVGDVQIQPERTRTQRFNTVRGTFVDPESDYVATEFIPYNDSNLQSGRDAGQKLTKDISLPMTNSEYMAQRIGYKMVALNDQQLRCIVPMNWKALKVGVGDRIQLSIDELSWSNKVFRVEGWTFDPDSGFNLTLQEDDATAYYDPGVSDYSTRTSAGTVVFADQPVPSPSNLSATAEEEAIFLQWANPVRASGYDEIIIYASATSAFSGATEIARTRGTSFRHELARNTQRYYWISAVDVDGRLSDEYAGTSTSSITATAGEIDFANLGGATKPEDNATYNIGALADLDTVDTDQIANNAVTITKIADTLQSTNYSAGTAGWKLTTGGIFEAGDGTFRGDITASSFTIEAGATVSGIEAQAVAGLPQASFTSIGASSYSPAVNGSRVTWTENGTEENWNTKLVSDQSFSGGAFVTFVVNKDNANNSRYMVGLANTATGNSFSVIDYAVYVNGSTGNIQVYESGSPGPEIKSTITAGDIITVFYDGNKAQYIVNGTVEREVSLTSPLTGQVYAHIAIDNGSTHDVEHRIDGLQFGPVTSVVENLNDGVSLTSGGLTLSSGGAIKGGQTAYDNGTGFFLGYENSAYKLSIGDSTGDKLTFDGADLTVTGDITATSLTLSGTSITEGQLESGVQDSLALADSALQIGDIAEIISAGNIPTGQLTFNDSGSKTVSYDGNNISVTGGNDNSWDTQVYSSEHYASPCVLQFETTFNSTYRFMMGLNEDPTTNASYASIDYCWYLNTSTATIYENGGQAAPDGGSFSYSVGDKFSIVYDGDNVYYYHNDTLKRTVTGVGAKDFYLDSSLYDTPLTINDVRFAPISRIDYGSIGGVTITPGKLYQGTGTFNNANTGFYLDSTGQFSLKDKLAFFPSNNTLRVKGNIEADVITVNQNLQVVGDLKASSLAIASITREMFTQDALDEIYGALATAVGGTNGDYKEASGDFTTSGGTVTLALFDHGQNEVVVEWLENYGFAQTTDYTGTALQATLIFEASTTSNFATIAASKTETITLNKYDLSVYYGSTYFWYYGPRTVTKTFTTTDLADTTDYYFRVRVTSVGAAFTGITYPFKFEANEGVTGVVSTGGNADTLDNIDSARFLRSDEDDTFDGNLVVTGNLTVNGTTVTLNTATLDVEDKNITLNYGAGDTSASANGAGITIQDAVNASTDATILWDATNNEFDFSHPVNVSGASSFGTLTITGSNSDEDALKITNGRAQLGHHTSGAGLWLDTAANAQYWFAGLSGNDFRLYRGGNKFTITDAGNVSIVGSITASGGNSGQWNTAYGWGNHASAGYLSSTSADTASGQITFTSTAQYPVIIDAGNNGKMVLRGSSSPYIRFQNGTTDQAFIQSTSSSLELKNQADSSSIRIKDDVDFSQDGTTYYSMWHEGNLPNASLAKVVKGTVTGVNNSTYVTAFTVEGDSLASSIRCTFNGTSGSVVVNALVDLQVNHYQDILISSMGGFYTKLTIKVVSNNNEDYAVEIKHNGSTTTSLAVEVYPLNSETVTFATSHSYTGTTLEHVCEYGLSHSGTGGSNANIRTDGYMDPSDGYRVGGSTIVDSTRRFYVGGGSIQHSGRISFLNGSNGSTGSGAQGIAVESLYAGTSYSNTAPSGMVNALNGYQVGNTTVLDSGRALSNVTGLDLSHSTSQAVNILATDSTADATFYAARIDHNASGSDTLTTDRSHVGLMIDMDSSATGGDTSNEHRLFGIYSDVRATGDSDLMYAGSFYVESQHSEGTISAIHGIQASAVADDTGTGHTANVYGVQGLTYAYNTGSGGTSNLYGLYGKTLLTTAADKNTNLAVGVYGEVEVDTSGVSTTLSNAYAFQAVIDQDATDTTITNAYLFRGDYTGTFQGTRWGIYVDDVVDNYFGGYVRSVTGFKISNTEVIDSARNLVNISTISSGEITTTAAQFKYVSNTDANVGLLIRDETYVSNEADITATRLNSGANLTLGLAGQAGINAYVNGSNVFSLNSSGNATFGGDISSKTLSVDPTANGPAINVGRYTGQPTIKAGTDDGGYLIMDSSGGMAALNWYSSDRVVLANGGGNVGIGSSTAATQKLYVSGSVRSTDSIRADAGFDVNGTTVITSARNATFAGLEGDRIGVNNTSATTKYGIALYGGYGSATNPTYGLLFTGTAGLGTHGNVTADWATYFTMNSTTGRGWIFRNQSDSVNVASISNAGEATFATVTIDNSAFGSHLILKRSGSSDQKLSPSGTDLLLEGGNFGPGVSGTKGLGRSDKIWSHVYSNSYQIGTTDIIGSDGVFHPFVAGNSQTAGGVFLAPRYADPHFITTFSTHYSSGTGIWGYGAAGKSGSGASTLVSTFSNFSASRSAVKLSGSAFSIVGTNSAVQTAVGSDLSVVTRFSVGTTDGATNVYGVLTSSNYIDSARGMHGGYGTTSGTGTAWGACIWSIGNAWNGSGTGTSYSIGTYGLHWLRDNHPSEYGFSNEGLYLTRASTTPFAAIGRTGAYFTTRVATTDNITAYYSDERLKEKTGVIENALDKVRSLEGFTYVENELARELGYNNNKEQVGLSAQQVQAVLPHAVSLAPVDYGDRVDGEIVSKSGEDYLTVDYSRLVPLLVESIKELSTEVERLKKLLEKDNGDD